MEPKSISVGKYISLNNLVKLQIGLAVLTAILLWWFDCQKLFALEALPFAFGVYFKLIGQKGHFIDKIVLIVVFVGYHAIILYPFSILLQIPFVFVLLWLYFIEIIIYGRKLIGLPLANSNDKFFCFCINIFWDPPLLMSIYISHKLGAQSFGPLVSIINYKICMGPLPIDGQVIDMFKEPYNIRAVINMCKETTGPINEYKQYNIKYIQIPTLDCVPPSLQDIQKGLLWIDNFFKDIQQQYNNDNNNFRVFIHCKGGQGRSATLVLCYLIRQGMKPQEALNMMLKERPTVNRGILHYPSVQEFIKTLQ